MNGLAICAGVGGLELGLELIFPSKRVICYVEREAFAASVLVARMEEQAIHKAPIWDDVTSFPSEQFIGKVDFITAGFPCTPFSKAGKLKGKEDDRWLWESIEEIICTVEPKFIFLENVTGLANRGLDSVLGSLSSLGYDAEWSSLRASESGSPHIRDRLFVLGFKPDWIQELAHSLRDGCLRYSSKESSNRGIGEGGLERSQFDSLRENASNTKRQSKQRRGISGIIHGEEKENKGKNRSKQWNSSIDSSSDVTNSSSKRRKGSKISDLEREKIPDFECSWWETEPPICRVDDGLAYRMDRLRSCGNGVVPIQAAHAFRSLVCRATGIEWTKIIEGVVIE